VLIDGVQVGEVTSGTFSPVLAKGIGLTYLPLEKSDIGNEISLDIRGKLISGRVVKTPFIEK
jgi:aminomethyltransferase